MTDDTLPLVPRDARPLAAQPDPLLVALEQGNIDAETIERLVALRERTEDRTAAREFNAAVSRFNRDCPPITKNKSSGKTKDAGTKYSYMFATLDHIAETIRPHLEAHGLCYTFDTESTEGLLKVTCTLRHEAGYSIRATFETPPDSGSMNTIQKRGSAQSYAMRYSLIQVLGLTTCEDDTDGVPPAERKPIETVTEDQARGLDTYATSLNMDMPHFLKWLGVASFADLPAKDHAKALAALKKVEGREGGEV